MSHFHAFWMDFNLKHNISQMINVLNSLRNMSTIFFQIFLSKINDQKMLLYKKFWMCSQLELQSTGPSTPSIIMDEEGNIIDSRDGSGEPIDPVRLWGHPLDLRDKSARSHPALRGRPLPFQEGEHPLSIYSTHCRLEFGGFATVTSSSYSLPGVLPAFLRSLWASWSGE